MGHLVCSAVLSYTSKGASLPITPQSFDVELIKHLKHHGTQVIQHFHKPQKTTHLIHQGEATARKYISPSVVHMLIFLQEMTHTDLQNSSPTTLDQVTNKQLKMFG